MLQVVATMQMFIESFVLTTAAAAWRQHAVRGDAHLSVRVRDERREQLQQRLGPRRVLMLVLAVFSGGFLWVTRERG